MLEWRFSVHAMKMYARVEILCARYEDVC